MTAAAAIELWRMSATELAEAIRTRQVSSAEVVEAHLRRIEAVNPAVNAIVIVLGEQAVQAAEAADRALAAGADLPPFHGVPFTIKDIIDVAGPTLGRIPHATAIEPEYATIGMQLTGVHGPLARRIADLRAAFGVLAGPTWRDPWTVPAPLRGPERPKPVRVALVADPSGHGTAEQVQEGVRKAATALEDAGYVIEEVEPPSIEAAAKALLVMLSTPGIRQGWQEFVAPFAPAETRRFMSAFFDAAGNPDAMAAEESFMTRQSVLRAWGEFQETRPLIVAPVCTEPPFEAGTDLDEGRVAETIATMRMPMAVNALGLPAVALPAGIGDGLPQAVQVIGPRYREDLCLDAAGAIEDRLGIITPIDPR